MGAATVLPQPKEREAPRPGDGLCHTFENWPRALCGADLTGRTQHEIGECYADGHPRCAVCESLDGWTVPGLDDDWDRGVPNN